MLKVESLFSVVPIIVPISTERSHTVNCEISTCVYSHIGHHRPRPTKTCNFPSTQGETERERGRDGGRETKREKERQRDKKG